MKKIRIFSLMIVAMFILSSFAVFAEYDLNAYPYDESREEYWVQAKAYNGTPTLDANITEGEGWSEAVTFDHKNMYQVWSSSSRCIISADVRYAWDDNGIYIAANITDPTMVTTTGEDEPDASTGANDYGWNGDVFIFALDPMMEFKEEGFATKGWASAWYCFSVREDGKLMCYATQTSPSGDITNKIEGKGIVTDGGWAFEAMIPWARIIADTDSVTNGVITFEKEDITELGTVSRAGLIYMDRAIFGEETKVFVDSSNTAEDGDIFTLSRDICIPVKHDDGMPYYDGGESARSYGIELTMADNTGYAPERVIVEDPQDTDDTSSATPEDPDDTGVVTTVPKTTEAKEYDSIELVTSPGKTDITTFAGSSVNNPGGGNGFPVGLVVGIAAGVVVIGAVVAIIIVKKKRS